MSSRFTTPSDKTKTDGDATRIVRQFLDTLSMAQTKDQACETCGTLLEFLSGAIFLYGDSETKGEIRLPFCPRCTRKAMTDSRHTRFANTPYAA
jgi:hypothetical protein